MVRCRKYQTCLCVGCYYILDHSLSGLFILKGVLSMNDFHEAVLSIEVEPSLATAYKKRLKMTTVGIGLKMK